MKRTATLLMLFASLLLLIENDLLARGPGGGGGGRGGGGGARGGGGPGGGGFGGGGGGGIGGGMPRPSTGAIGGGGAGRPGAGAGSVGRPGAGAGGVGGAGRLGVGAGGVGAAGRPSAGQINDFMNIPRPGAGAGGNLGVGGGFGGANGVGGRPGGAAADFLSGGAGASQLPAGRVPGAGTGAAGVGKVGAGAARQNLSNSRPERVENRQELQGNRQQRRDEIRSQVADNHPRMDFWSDHPGWASWRINAPYRWATYAALSSWVGYGSAPATAYSYGDNIYYSDNQVYYGDQPVASADEYAQQAATLAASAPQEIKPEKSDWLPLGVFAVTQDGQASGADPTLYMQLAISKEGVITGTLKNMASGQSQTLEGMADKKSQRVAWGVAGKERPIIETGISNLTQDTAPALIHFADGQTQQWLLVRLEEPK